jgi:S-DNA-T family DNA segregation ATPase FtsK/SpoIIIE
MKTDTTTQRSVCDLDAVAALVERLGALGRERDQREREWSERRLAAQREGGEAVLKVRNRIEQPADPGTLDADLGAAKAERERRLALVSTAGVRQRRALRERLERALERLDQEPMDPKALAERQSAMQRRRENLKGAVAQQRERAEELDEAIATAIRQHGLSADRAATPKQTSIPNDPEQAVDGVRVQLDWIESKLAQALERGTTSICGRWTALLLHALIVLPHALALAGCYYVFQTPAYMPWIGVSMVASVVIFAVVVAVLRRALGRRIATIRADLPGLTAALDRIEARSAETFDPSAIIQQRVGHILNQDAAREERIQAMQQSFERAVARSKAREAALRDRIVQTATSRVSELHRRAHASGAGRLAALQAELAAAESALQRRLATIDDESATGRERLATAVAAWQTEAQALAAAQTSRIVEEHPAWDDGGAWRDWQPPANWGQDVPLGTISATVGDLAAAVDATRLPIAADLRLRFPAALAYPGVGSLLVRSGPDGREAAVRLINQTVLRALAAFPPGRIRLTIIDPVGLGQTFPRLLDLGEHGEAVLSGGVLAEATRIERGLDDLCAHLEKVIQKHLRGKYATLDDYNREAGELQEPMRLVVVADLPAGFGERAMERLGILLRSGARCGVHLLILHDDRQALPAAIDLAWFRRMGVLVRQVHGHLALDREQLHAFRLDPEPEPPTTLTARLVSVIGQAAVSAKRVAVPFAAIAPAAEAMWSHSTAERLRLPIGKCGADRLQYLELGRGTAQHVLVGGRTGSGKSTLFHVLIASAATWFHPRELELHLIDFKKGVEFKAYATHRLPHAKVVAIESDREFGLSVLRNLDAELIRRGNLFRAAGAQDLAAHRRHSAANGGEHLPRVLLIIDEFQEIFTEDDSIARDAALLLDRFVRQGRAFGLHVILGSQTLGGSYSMAKSSLGQMGVRIVLPCNETDANLLLHEDNDGARLLTRPGDAIYNDQAGLKDGNSPFQVCWLNDQDEAAQLSAVSSRAAVEGWKPVRQVIFEGDSPSRLEDEADLAAMADRPWAEADARSRAWIGQASSLRGAAEVVLPANAGGNLLIVGQNREAAVATCAALTVGLGLRHQVGALRLHTLDGEDADGPCASLHATLAASLPHRSERREVRDAGPLVAEIAKELDRRQAGGTHPPLILTVFGLQRLRALRQDDDMGMGRGGESPAEAFARILANGPEYGIHTVVWVDTLASLQRTLGRRALKDFEQRICFQMSAADSTEILDDDAASRLGLHTALLVALGEGRREKFRPYRVPEADVLARYGAAMQRRGAAG